MGAEMPHGSDRPPLLRAVLRHHWPTVVAAVLICALVGTAVGLAKARSYRSTATVLIAPLEGVPYSPESVARQSQANTDALTDARLAATPAVARLVEESLRLPGNSLAWRSSLSVEVVPNTQVVKIGFRASSARRARQMANAFSTDYLRYRATRSQASVSGQLASLQSRAQQVQRRLTAANRALVSNQPSANRTSLNQQVTIYTDQLAALSIQTAQLSGASRDPGQVLTPAGSAAATGVPTSRTHAGRCARGPPPRPCHCLRARVRRPSPARAVGRGKRRAAGACHSESAPERTSGRRGGRALPNPADRHPDTCARAASDRGHRALSDDPLGRRGGRTRHRPRTRGQ